MAVVKPVIIDLTDKPEDLTLLPDKIKILHREYLLISDDLVNAMKNGREGEINYADRTIHYVDHDNSETADTIIHEILHGIFNAFGLSESIPMDVEEPVVSRLANGLVTVMKDNPTLFPILQDIVDNG